MITLAIIGLIAVIVILSAVVMYHRQKRYQREWMDAPSKDCKRP